MVIAASAPEDEHQTHKKMEKLAVGMNMAGSGFSMIVSNLTIGVIKDTGGKNRTVYPRHSPLCKPWISTLHPKVIHGFGDPAF